MKIGVIGTGAFGSAMVHVLTQNGFEVESVGEGGHMSAPCSLLILAVPVQQLRSALIEHASAYDKSTLFVNCAKGIEKKTGALPKTIVENVIGACEYAVLGGPSFAREILNNVSTVVNVATKNADNQALLKRVFTNSSFVVEGIDSVLELELAGAMKNIYALSAGYIEGSGGGENTKAHMQVVALREYTTLIHALEGSQDVVRPSVVGDLILTCASKESRNYTYGYALACNNSMPSSTVEGVHTAEAIMILAASHNITLPLAAAIYSVITDEKDAKGQLYRALGFATVPS